MTRAQINAAAVAGIVVGLAVLLFGDQMTDQQGRAIAIVGLLLVGVSCQQPTRGDRS
jgi:hypothetical protein